jgi:hypothetical protein
MKNSLDYKQGYLDGLTEGKKYLDQLADNIETLPDIEALIRQKINEEILKKSDK